MEALERTLSAVFIACFVYVMISAYALRWMIDESKLKEKRATIFRSVTPPREVLTELGMKVWWSRLLALVAGLAALGAVFAVRGS